MFWFHKYVFGDISLTILVHEPNDKPKTINISRVLVFVIIKFWLKSISNKTKLRCKIWHGFIIKKDRISHKMSVLELTVTIRHENRHKKVKLSRVF